MTSQRDAFWGRVYELAKAGTDLVIVSADMGAPALDRFRLDFPMRFIHCGIAEQQMIGAAAGLSLGGKKVFCYAIAPFVTLRCYEHIRVELAMMNVPVTLVGVGAGFSYDDSGPTHHAVEDLAVMRILPRMEIDNATDSTMAAALADLSIGLDHPNYVRLDRKTLPTLYPSGHDFSPGFHFHVPPADACILATGNMVAIALKVSETLRQHGLAVGVADCYRLPLPAAIVPRLQGVPLVFTAEEHTLPGGFGSAVLELLADNGLSAQVRRFGLDFSDGYDYHYGGRAQILEARRLDAASLAGSILTTMGSRANVCDV